MRINMEPKQHSVTAKETTLSHASANKERLFVGGSHERSQDLGVICSVKPRLSQSGHRAFVGCMGEHFPTCISMVCICAVSVQCQSKTNVNDPREKDATKTENNYHRAPTSNPDSLLLSPKPMALLRSKSASSTLDKSVRL